MEEEGSSEVGSSGKASLSEKVVLMVLTVEAGAVKKGLSILAINHHGACAIKAERRRR